MQALVEQEIGVFGQGLPGRQRALGIAVQRRLVRIVYIVALPPRAGFGVLPEQGFEFGKQVPLGAEMGDGSVLLHVFFPGLFHGFPIVFVKTVAFDDGRDDALAPENLLEGGFHLGRTGPGRARNGDDWMFFGHGDDCGVV